jgi:hypothetical protein
MDHFQATFRLSVSLWICLAWGQHGGSICAAATPARQMAERIDSVIEQRLSEQGVVPAPECDDATFFRRASLDLTGVVPLPSEIRAFLADDDAEKRTKQIDHLLASPRHPLHLAITWRRILLPGESDPQQLASAAGLQQWLHQQFARELRYDRLVAEFLSATGDEQTGPALFYRTLEAKPEKLAAATSRVFLGLQIQCAECHDHPFDAWSQRDFWEYAAFFARLQPAESTMADRFRLVDLPTGEVTLPDTQEIIAPQFPSGQSPPDDTWGTRRRQLAIWMASGDNPYLAPAAVNRVWSQLFGYGLVHPVDDFGPQNPATYPQLLDELSQFFVEHQFDLGILYRTLASTRAYQRQSTPERRHSPPAPDFADSASSPHNDDTILSHDELARQLAFIPVRRLTADQLYDSLTRTLGLPAGEAMTGNRNQFISLMESTSRDTVDYDLGLQQALRLMNGEELSGATAPGADGILGALRAPLWTHAQRLDIVFLASLSRLPSDPERQMCLKMLGESDRQQVVASNEQLDTESTQEMNQQRIWSDIVWAVLNSAEYQFNH